MVMIQNMNVKITKQSPYNSLSCPTRKFSTKGYISFKHNTLIVSLTYFQREFISEEMFIVSTLFIFQVCMFSQWEIGSNFPALFGCIALIVLLAVPNQLVKEWCQWKP